MKRYTEEEKIEILKEVESLGNVSLVAKKHGMPTTTIQNWIRKGLSQSDSSEIKKTISQQKLQISILKNLFKKNSPSLLVRKAVAKYYINQNHVKSVVLRACGLSRSGYYRTCKILPLVQGKGNQLSPNWGGYKVLSRYLLGDHGLRVNAKKVYRLCQESGLLLPRTKKKRRKYEKICVNRRVNGPNQLWEFDIKQGVIHGENRAFYFLAFIDVFVREIVGYHI